MSDSKYYEKPTFLIKEQKTKNILPADFETVKQLSFAEPLKTNNIMFFKPIPKHVNRGSYKCPVVLWITVFFLIFALFQAILTIFLFSECKILS
jgi:hypothetical protein